MKTYLKNNDENSKKNMHEFRDFQKKIQRIFDVFNEEQRTKKIVQYLIQKTSIIEYAARFQKRINQTK